MKHRVNLWISHHADGRLAGGRQQFRPLGRARVGRCGSCEITNEIKNMKTAPTSNSNAITEIAIVQSTGGDDGRYCKLKLRFANGRRGSLDLSHEQLGQLISGVTVDVTANYQDAQ